MEKMLACLREAQGGKVKKWLGFVFAIGIMLQTAGAWAGPEETPCGTNGPLGVTTPDPSSYSYTRTAVGETKASFTISSPQMNINSGCNSKLPYVYGNGKSDSDINVEVSVGEVSSVLPTEGLTLSEKTTLQDAFSMAPWNFTLIDPGTGSQQIQLTFTNTAVIPAGTYDVTLDAKPETGVGVGAASTTFTVTVLEPTAFDTQPPTVTINAPTNNSAICLNGDVDLNFTALDPPEDGAGTGITVVDAKVASTGGTVSIFPALTIDPVLPVEADVTVNATGSIPADAVGSYTVTATADDAAGHTGQAVSGYKVSVNVSALPPMSVAGRQFKAGSTLPIKWTFTDCEGNLLPPFASVSVSIISPTGSDDNRTAGTGAANIRWELDAYGNALHYITNYDIPAIGTYAVKVFVGDVDGVQAEQGQLSFIAAGKGGK
ncbi:MAG: hypothetical protein A2521_09615 [Deltaproteobacteria bacterium RIFOXYD12_FULL_57_12]|nr:MAG: hypothetical protein A2521_09615 [Deltaproteobacteria bacterium RIFOXYD12_FULL_57_12]